MASCPECEGVLMLTPPARAFDIVECGECRSELEVVAVDPVILALAPEVEEDWGE